MKREETEIVRVVMSNEYNMYEWLTLVSFQFFSNK